MTFEQIMDSLKARNFRPVYFLHGKESYFIDKISDYIERNVLTEGERSFNQTILYGKDTDFQTLRDIISRYPMMAERQVVILKELFVINIKNLMVVLSSANWSKNRRPCWKPNRSMIIRCLNG